MFYIPDERAIFFTADWKDVYIAGLEYSYKLVANAMRSLFKVPFKGDGVKILLITPNTDTVRWMSLMLQYLASQLSLQLMPLLAATDAFGESFYVFV